ncbi:MAG: hypothetical protein R3315_08070, partial [Woeseiaceae bacterium]|nr:hypothetical protein [Woeseiaceae bacterium]
GAPADFIALDGAHPSIAGHGDDTLLDALVFSASGSPIDRVMVAGAWQTSGGRHLREASIQARFRSALRELFPGAGGES